MRRGASRESLRGRRRRRGEGGGRREEGTR